MNYAITVFHLEGIICSTMEVFLGGFLFCIGVQLIDVPKCHSGRESAWWCRRRRRCRFSPWVGKTPWRRRWQPTPVFSPGKFHGQRSLAGYSPQGHKEWDTTEMLSTHSPLTICDSFRWTVEGLSHIYTCFHSPLNPSPTQTATWPWAVFHELCNKSLLVIHIKYSSVYMIIPTPPPPLYLQAMGNFVL